MAQTGIYKIFENGELINRIVADEEFCKKYCEDTGYTYELEPQEPEPEPEPEPPTEMEQLRADVDFIAAITGVEL